MAVIDEIQMIKDISRGWAWTRALLGIQAKEIHLCGETGTIELINSLMLTTGEDVEVGFVIFIVKRIQECKMIILFLTINFLKYKFRFGSINV